MTDNTESTEVAVPAQNPIRAGGQVKAIIPQDAVEAFRLSKAIADSGLAPNGVRDPNQIMVILMKGSEVGFAPMQALSSIASINGRLSIYGDGLPAVVYRAGGKLDETIEGNGDGRTATCVVTRPDGHKVKGEFSVLQAKQARLWGKSGPWQQYPDRMLKMRARGFAVRDGMPDALNGLFIAEDIQDAPPVTPPADITAPPASANRLQARLGTATDEAPEADEMPVDEDETGAATDTADASEVPHFDDNWNEITTDQNAA